MWRFSHLERRSNLKRRLDCHGPLALAMTSLEVNFLPLPITPGVTAGATG
jgi:hypothetical protein